MPLDGVRTALVAAGGTGGVREAWVLPCEGSAPLTMLTAEEGAAESYGWCSQSL